MTLGEVLEKLCLIPEEYRNEEVTALFEHWNEACRSYDVDDVEFNILSSTPKVRFSLSERRGPA